VYPPPALHPGLSLPARHRSLIETEGRNDRLKRAAVSQKSGDYEHQLFWLVQAVECGAGRLAKGAPATFALVAALFLAVDHDVPFALASVSATVFVVTELLVRVVGGVMWLAGALAVQSRLWLGGVVSMSRDRDLIRALLSSRVRSCGLVRAVLLCTDGLASYPKAAIHLFREPLRTGKPGRPRLILPKGVMIAQVIKSYAKRRVMASWFGG
jgi:hypothetical protein